jgi:hypothetical protein
MESITAVAMEFVAACESSKGWFSEALPEAAVRRRQGRREKAACMYAVCHVVYAVRTLAAIFRQRHVPATRS